MNCKKCSSENLFLELRVKGEDVMTANMVALKCSDCCSWVKWCPKEDRKLYSAKKKPTTNLTIEDFAEQLTLELDEHISHIKAVANGTNNLGEYINGVEYVKSKIKGKTNA